jgi:hypothetical protein
MAHLSVTLAVEVRGILVRALEPLSGKGARGRSNRPTLSAPHSSAAHRADRVVRPTFT